MIDSRRTRAAALVLIPLLALAGCGGDKQKQAPPPPTVGVITAEPSSAAIDTELPGRTEAYQVSDVRPQVSGLILKRLFTEGGLVRRGQPLYLIDPALYRASVSQAQGQLASAEASAVTARLKAERYTALEKMNAVAKQDASDARAAAGEAEASIVQQKAALQTARINLQYTRVDAPISGRISRSTVTPGALVTASQDTALATITQLDPIYVDIQESAGDLLALRKAIAAGGAIPDKAPVRLKLDDGSDYGRTGTLQFSEVQVDPSTGAVTLRALFPNPDGLLMPGMFVRAVVTQAQRRNIFLLPGEAVTHDVKGAASVLVVGADGKVVQKPVDTGGIQGGQWVITGGIAAGDRVIVQGSAKAQPGTQVKAVAASSNPAVIDKNAKGGGGKSGKDKSGGGTQGASAGASQ